MTSFIKTTRTYYIIIIMALLWNACTKKSGQADTTKPVITVVEPLANDTVSLATEPEIHVEFTVTDETGLHHLSVIVIKNNTDTLMNETPDVLDLKVYSFHEHLIPTNIASVTPMKVIIRAEDHAGNTETKTIAFFIQP